MTTVVGIDPGNQGGIAVLRPGAALVYPMPVLPTGKGARLAYDAGKIAGMLRLLLRVAPGQTPDVLVAIERMNGAPGMRSLAAVQSIVAGPALFQGIAAALRLPYVFVQPQAWQRALLTVPAKAKGAKTDARRKAIKAASVLRASQLFPGVGLLASDRARKASDGMAEALLIAEYARREHAGQNGGRP